MKILLSIFLLTASALITQAQNKTLGVGTPTPNPNAALHVESPTNNQGFIMPRLTTLQRTGMGSLLTTADNGLMLYDTDLKTIYIWDGATWKSTAQVAGGSKLSYPYKDSVTTTLTGNDVFALKYNNAANKRVLRVENLSATNGSSAVSVQQNGTGIGIFSRVDNPAAGTSAIYGTTNSNLGGALAPVGVYGESTGTGSLAGSFRVSNAANAFPALYAETNGTGNVLNLNQINAGNTAAIVNIANAGTGNAIQTTGKISAGQFIGDGSLLTNLPGGGGGWGLTGNTGTVDGTSFIGTTDNVALNFKVNNANAGRIDAASFNTFLGANSGNSTMTGGQNNSVGGALTVNASGAFNNAVGSPALNANTTGSNNNAFGRSSMINNTTGNFNVAMGDRSLFSSVAGSNATAIGTNAMRNANNTATPFTNANVAVGFEALRGSTTASANTGNSNTAIGYQSLLNNTTGSSNSANGYFSLLSNTTGSNNTTQGLTSLYFNTTGSGNTSLGNFALFTNVTGSNNTSLGYNADVVTGALTNATAIGYNAKVSASNSMVLGGTGVDAVKVGIGVTAPAAYLDIAGNVKIADGTQGVGKVLTSDASGLASWTTPGGFTLPYSNSISSSSSVFDITNTGTGFTTFQSRNTGTGRSAIFQISNPANSAYVVDIQSDGIGSALNVSTTGSASAGNFVTNNLTATNSALSGQTTSTTAGSGVYGAAVGATGNAHGIIGNVYSQGHAGLFQTINSLNSNSTLRASSDGIGSAATFDLTNGSNNSDALTINHSGTGMAITANRPIAITNNSATGNSGNFFINNAANNGTAITAYTQGMWRAGDFQILNASNPNSALLAANSGLGIAGTFVNGFNILNAQPTISSQNYGIGSAGSFETTNASSSASSLIVNTSGTGSATSINITNATNTSAAVSISHSGTGNAITATGKIQATSFQGDGSLLTNVIPSGIIMPFAGTSSPSGYLLCDGSVVSRTTFANLFAAIGTSWGVGDGSTTFNLPDFRGRFMRGVDGGAGIDPDAGSRVALNGGAIGDNVGSYQDDQYLSHTHNVPSGGYSNSIPPGDTFVAGLQAWNGGQTTTAAGGNETRPKNAYVNYIIKI